MIDLPRRHIVRRAAASTLNAVCLALAAHTAWASEQTTHDGRPVMYALVAQVPLIRPTLRAQPLPSMFGMPAGALVQPPPRAPVEVRTATPVDAGGSTLYMPPTRSVSPGAEVPSARAGLPGGSIGAAIRSAARTYAVEESLIRAVIDVESNFNPQAVSSKGAAGLMQLMPGTARRFGVDDVKNPQQNVHAGTRYLRMLLDLFGGDVRLALAAYNAGEGAVLRHKRRVPPYEETQDYVRLVLARYRQLR